MCTGWSVSTPFAIRREKSYLKVNPNAEELFGALVKAGVFLPTEDGVKAFAQLLITLNKKYPGWSK